MLTCRVVDTERVDAKCRASGGAEQVVADVSIVLTIIEQFSAEFLTQNKTIWEPYFRFKKSIRDTTWSKVVIYKILMDIFEHQEGLDLLEEEIKIFNGLNPVIKPN